MTTHLIVGPARHGVVSFALDLVDSLERVDYSAPVFHVEDWNDLDDVLGRLGPLGGVHLNFTDRLFGADAADAADRVTALVTHVGARVTATLHDVPQPADGGNYPQRLRAYRTVCEAVHACATNSEHERLLLGENGIAAPADVTVVPLPLLIAGTPARGHGTKRRSVAVLGFVYPGKGHAEVLAAMAGLPGDVEFRAIGECSAGHENLADVLADGARASGRRFTITGYVPRDELSAALQSVSVPIAHHRHVSASGSLNTWIAAHRRPLAPVNRYTVEHQDRHPGTLRLYPDTDRGLAAAIDAALAEPDSTWLAAGITSGCTPDDAARRYAEVLARWHD